MRWTWRTAEVDQDRCHAAVGVHVGLVGLTGGVPQHLHSFKLMSGSIKPSFQGASCSWGVTGQCCICDQPEWNGSLSIGTSMSVGQLGLLRPWLPGS